MVAIVAGNGHQAYVNKMTGHWVPILLPSLLQHGRFGNATQQLQVFILLVLR